MRSRKISIYREKIIALLFLRYVSVPVLRLSAPFDIDDHGQAKQVLYILDVEQKGSFFFPTERCTKHANIPFLYNWVAAGISLAWGRVTDTTIKLSAVLLAPGTREL
ncbi:MAG: hypothetical protein JSW70_06995 [Syntrophobacterales bacterium]|nr:MAG: hypothetical protein JSW70_06995 [Syntrophobacterales bacterium]